jgi:tetratricopeptide (TPR) repeat protein
MAKVPLRKYNSEIESLIERGQTDEAIAHCRHILKTFPKHLETYRLLGKAYLESKRHSEATDIFNRVLMSVPDDFVSHVGLSIIADEQKRLDDAIWHMERAFEKQPSNAAIQAELQRLYGRRDGREPTKIRLTRGALAHMYYQGELYTQAISEAHAVLAEEPNRIDLQPLLALAYFRAGQKVEASETCSQLISQFPYSFDANRMLVEILPGTGMAESVNTYQQRVLELDPYAAYTRGSIFQTEDAPDASVSLERLDYKGQPVETSPDWGKSLGIGLDAAPPSNAQPEWLKSNYSAEPASPSSKAFDDTFDSPRATFEPAAPVPSDRGPFDETPAPAQAEGEAIPGWMRQAGWGASSGAFDESAVSISDEPAEGELAKADLPDWIKSMAPKQTEPPAAAPAAPSDDDTLEWLNKLGGDKPFETAHPSEPSQEAAFTAPASETSDWMSELGGAGQVAASAAAAETADWLSKLDDSPDSNAPVQESTSAADTAAWLSQLDDSLDSGQDKPVQESTSAAETADWLSKLDESFDFAHDKTFGFDQKTPSDFAEEKSVDNAPPAEVPAPAASGMETGIGSLGTSAAEQDAAMLWLESLAAKQGAKSEELITNPEERLEKPPEWVEQAKVAGEPQPVAQAPEEKAPVSEPVWDEADLTESAPSERPLVEQTGVWLRELDERDFQPGKPVEAEPASWSGEIEIAPPRTEPLDESAPEADLPTWLRGLEAREAAPAVSPTEEMPEWLKGDEPEVPAPPEPTIPADWMPESQKVTPRPIAPAPKPEPKPEPRPEPRKAAVRKPEPKPKPETAVPVDRSKVKRTGMLPPLIDPNLAFARDAMEHGKIPDALQVYGNLIRKGKLLEDITFDLKEALYRFPVEVSIWQALGDAYMRANRLQDALDAYTKAEELLR